MFPCRLSGICAVVAGAVVLTAAVAVQDKGKDTKPKPAPASAPIDPEMMAKWTAYATPGPDHKVLDALAGKWTAHVKTWMDAAAPAEESEGSCDTQWIMGGRFLKEDFKGSMMGQPFEGTSVMGFDNLKKKYVGTWIDTMGTGIMTSEGTYDAAKKTLTCSGECPDQTMSKLATMRMVTTFVDANTHKMEMFGPDKSGKEMRHMEITYTRAK